VPSLRNVADRAPYMHAGQFATLGEVLAHYNRAPKAPADRSEIEPLKLNARALAELEALLRALSGGTQLAAPARRSDQRGRPAGGRGRAGPGPRGFVTAHEVRL
jgi:cytochrome c peroxidase